MVGPYGRHFDGGHPFLHVLLMVLFVLLVAAIAVLLYRLLTRRQPGYAPVVSLPGAPAADALAIVRLRYARGEIKRDEYLRMSSDFGAPAGVRDEPASPAGAPGEPAELAPPLG